jgi:hypothetical protein
MLKLARRQRMGSDLAGDQEENGKRCDGKPGARSDIRPKAVGSHDHSFSKGGVESDWTPVRLGLIN